VIDANSRRRIAEMAGQNWDNIEKPGKEAAQKAGNSFPVMPAAEVERVRAAVKPEIDKFLKELSAGGFDATPSTPAQALIGSTRSSARCDQPRRPARLRLRRGACWSRSPHVGRSITGRALLGTPAGDFELVQIGCGASIAAFLPYCQLQRGNIIVDFFTVRASRGVQGALDAFGALLVALVMAVLAWRTAVGMVAVRAAGEVSMIVGFPIWIGYAAIVPSLVLATVVALSTAQQSWKARG
jgi:hypothetical protein